MRRGVRRVLVLAVVAAAATGSAGTFGQDAGRAAPRPPQQAQAPAGRPKAAPANRPAAAAPAQAKADPNDPRLKQLLAAWEKQSTRLKTLDVTIDRVDTSDAWGDETFEGR